MKTNLFNSKFLLAGTIMVSLALGLGSCEKDEPEIQKEEVKTVQIAATAYTEWVYFSFEKGAVVTVEKADESLEWDLGFMRYNTRTNSGKSGKGQGGALTTDAMKMEEVTKLPSKSFVVDDEIEVMAVRPDGTPIMPPPAELPKVAASKELAWATFDGKGTYTYNNKVYIIRTADGKYAKVIMKSFQDGEGKGGLVTMDYVYPFVPQP